MNTRALLALLALPILAGAQARGRAPAAPVVTDSFALQPPQRQSWTSDRLRLGVGDIVTVLIDERTLATASLRDDNSDRRTKDLGADLRLPGSGTAPSTRMQADMSFDNRGDQRTLGESARQSLFRSQMSVRVVAVSPTGMLQIRGSKLVNVDKNPQNVALTGWIRPQDIAPGDNTVESARIADAQLTYAQSGKLGKPKSSMIAKLLGAVWP
ncbi:MAG: flagellar basal body L-ring protein FlgH [Gemmatimonadaceae bacterium]|nr:flagellar basal body L-ring protein FlgH [Gemmatimonadaceae bacterium]